MCLATQLSVGAPLEMSSYQRELLETEPYQGKLHFGDVEAIKMNDKTIFEKADYKISGVVLSAKNYEGTWFGDVMPVDLLLGFGTLANPEMRAGLLVEQFGRKGAIFQTSSSPMKYESLTKHFSNNHLVPINDEVKNVLNDMKQGDEIYLEGSLVDIYSDKESVQSSVSRTDEGEGFKGGPGACEVILIKKAINFTKGVDVSYTEKKKKAP